MAGAPGVGTTRTPGPIMWLGRKEGPREDLRERHEGEEERCDVSGDLRSQGCTWAR